MTLQNVKNTLLTLFCDIAAILYWNICKNGSLLQCHSNILQHVYNVAMKYLCNVSATFLSCIRIFVKAYRKYSSPLLQN